MTTPPRHPPIHRPSQKPRRRASRRAMAQHLAADLPHPSRKADLTDGNGKRLACKKLATVRENATRGTAVRLYPIGEDSKLALTEGIETGLAVNLMTALPVWACVSAFGLEHVVLPEEAREFWIFAD